MTSLVRSTCLPEKRTPQLGLPHRAHRLFECKRKASELVQQRAGWAGSHLHAVAARALRGTLRPAPAGAHTTKVQAALLARGDVAGHTPQGLPCCRRTSSWTSPSPE